VQNTFEDPPRPSLADGVSGTPAHAVDEPQDWSERLQRWAAALVTALLHLLLLLLVMQEPAITLTTPRGGSGGSRMDVTLIDQTLPPSSSPSPPEPVPPKKPKAPRAIKRPPPTPVEQGTVPMPPVAADTAKTSTAPPEPPDAQRDRVVVGFPTHRRPDDASQANAELAAKLGINRGQSDTPAPAGPNMGVDGFHVYYELVNETRLRAWRNQGMTELFLPMPGTRRLMVCPLEVALRRGYGECRMVEQDSPQLKVIGDAREVINIQRVYQRGDVVWSGPGPYR